MLESLTVRTFKSLEDVTVDLGLVNVFIGANGSGKSNLLEALGVLSAAADGKVDDLALLARGVRPGLPALYKTAFPAQRGKRIPPHLYFGATSAKARYEVSLHNPLEEPVPAWRFKTERLQEDDSILVSRMPTQRAKTNPERGLAALKTVESTEGDALELLRLLQGYVIFSPATAVLRGVAPEAQPRLPVGLSGGNLPRAILDLLKQRNWDKRSKRICGMRSGLLIGRRVLVRSPRTECRFLPPRRRRRLCSGFVIGTCARVETSCPAMTLRKAPCMRCFSRS